MVVQIVAPPTTQTTQDYERLRDPALHLRAIKVRLQNIAALLIDLPPSPLADLLILRYHRLLDQSHRHERILRPREVRR